MEQDLRYLMSKYIKSLRRYVTDYKIRLQMDEVVKLLDGTDFSFEQFNSLVEKENQPKIVPKMTIELPTNKVDPLPLSKTPVNKISFTARKYSIENPLSQIYSRRINTDRNGESAATCSTICEEKTIKFDHSDISKQLKFNLNQFKRNTQALNFIFLHTHEIHLSYSGCFDQKKPIDESIKKQKLQQLFMAIPALISEKELDKMQKEYNLRKQIIVPGTTKPHQNDKALIITSTLQVFQF
ncbi:hypothetical protein pb186bvf_013296 [Paramecium bursaria]